MSEKKATINAKALAERIQYNVKAVHFNVEQEVIVTTEDKLRLCLMRHLRYVEKRRGWITPLGILLTILVTFVTTTFRDIGFSGYTWQAIFAIAGALTFLWLCRSVYQATKTTKVEDLVKELKKSQITK